MLKRRKFLLVICFAALYLSAVPAMAGFVDLTANQTLMTVTDVWNGTTATTIVEAEYPTSTMNMYIKDNDGNILQSLVVEPYDLTATLVFTGSGNDYSAIGSLVINDTSGKKIDAAFLSDMVTFTPGAWISTLTMTGSLTPQPGKTSILSESSSWEFANSPTEKIFLTNADEFDHGIMVVFEMFLHTNSLQEYLSADGAQGQGELRAQIHSTPIPAAVLLGIIGLGVVGLKLRRFT